MTARMRSLLQVGLDGYVEVAKSDADIALYSNKRLSRFDPLWKSLLGFTWVDLRVARGEDTDEGTGTVRVRSDVLALLGVSSGDELDVVWKGPKATVCRAIQMTFPAKRLDEDKSEGAIQICGSDRNRIGVKINDVVSVRRRPLFMLEKNADRLIASVLSGVGVVVTLKEFIPVSLVEAVALVVPASLIMTYLFFFKIRSEVQVT
jgi:hypothetical protein